MLLVASDEKKCSFNNVLILFVWVGFFFINYYERFCLHSKNKVQNKWQIHTRCWLSVRSICSSCATKMVRFRINSFLFNWLLVKTRGCLRSIMDTNVAYIFQGKLCKSADFPAGLAILKLVTPSGYSWTQAFLLFH